MLPKIGVDLDSTITKMMSHWLSKYNKEYDDTLCEEDIIDWNIEKFIKPEAIKSGAMWKYLMHPDFFFEVEPEDDAIEGMNFLNSISDLYVVTAYTAEACLGKARWIRKHLPFFPEKNIIFANNKSLIGVDYLIDDGLHNMDDHKFCALFDRPWNAGGNYFRFYSWQDIIVNFEKYMKRWNKE